LQGLQARTDADSSEERGGVSMSKLKHSELKSLKLKRDKDGRYYLRAVYEMEDNYRRTELIIPKILLPVSSYPTIKTDCDPYFALHPHATANIGFGAMDLGKGIAYPDVAECCYAEKILEEKTQTMTLAEIEKKLGYKINLVSEEKEK
jgi:hypothetical protein